jgi:hypothetical protein
LASVFLKTNRGKFFQKKFAFKAQFPSIAKPLLKMQGNPTIQPNQIAWKLEITMLEIAWGLEITMLEH